MGSPDGTKVKSKCVFSPEVGSHAELAVLYVKTFTWFPLFCIGLSLQLQISVMGFTIYVCYQNDAG